jgi:8-oxo-dGTP pyrophosphatase MutT (NUDIX family)
MSADNLLERLRRLLNPVEDSDAGAAVVVLLRKGERGDLQLFLVKRATNPRDPWSGNMALPGGRRHPEDRDIKATVIRETLEETSIDISGCRFLGTLDAATSTRAVTRLVVLPFVVVCGERSRVTLNKELVDCFWFPVDQLKPSEGKALMEGNEVPAFLVKGEVVWGLTYRMLKNFLDLLDKAAAT